MGILDRASPPKVPHLDLELTTACDQRCVHCYNVWNRAKGASEEAYPVGQLETAEHLALIEKAVRQSQADHLTITGGEPLLHKDALTIIERACALVADVTLVTNGRHVTAATAKRLASARVRSVQLTFLAAEAATHDRLKGAQSFDDTVRAALNLRDVGVPVQVCFVATTQNWRCFPDVLELCLAIGVRAVSYNRMSAAGAAVERMAELIPEVEQVEFDLEAAERLGRRWNIRVSTAMPIPPCLVRIERYPWVQFGFCSTGTSSPNLAIDPLGNVRACNLSPRILGNLVRQDWHEIMRNPYPRKFRRQVPRLCQGCHYERTCGGGCKESACAAFGALDALDPFVAMALGRSVKRAGT